MKQTQISDQDLIKKYLDGSEDAFEFLLKRHKQKVFAFIMSKLGDESLANDVFQDTFIKAIRTLKRGKYNEEGKFLPWVLRIAHNLVIDHFRKTSKVNKIYEGDGGDDYSIFNTIHAEDDWVEKDLINGQVFSDLKIIIEELPLEQRQVLKMRFYQDMSFKEIAEDTGVSINTALGRMRYAIINLRKIIQERNLNFSLIQ